MTLLNLMLRGGLLMYVLLLLSIVVIALVLEKYRMLSKVRRANEKLLTSLSQQEKPDSIRAVLRIHGQGSPVGIMLDKLYNAQVEDADLISSSMEVSANMELHKLEKGMGWLSTIAAIAPLIGFLGTVTGMVRVFMNIQGQGQNSLNITSLAGGIWEALLTTIGGLIVGIIAIVLHNDLVQNLENLAKEMQKQAIDNSVKYYKARNKDIVKT